MSLNKLAAPWDEEYAGEYEVYQNVHDAPYWDSKGAGAILIARDTGKVLLALRSKYVNEPHTWGTIGGKVDAGENEETAALREIREETSYSGPVDLIPAYVYIDEPVFEYHNFIGIVPEEFEEPPVNWETEKFKWMSLEDAMKIPNKHPGLSILLNEVRSKIEDIILKNEIKEKDEKKLERNSYLEPKELENLYELMYKYQILQAEEYLPDRAYVELEKLKERLNLALNSGIKALQISYANWIRHHAVNDEVIFRNILYKVCYENNITPEDLIEEGVFTLEEVTRAIEGHLGYIPDDIDRYLINISYTSDIFSFYRERLREIVESPWGEKWKNEIEAYYERIAGKMSTFGEISSMKEMLDGFIENNLSDFTIDEKLLMFNEALNVAHHTGNMSDYLVDPIKYMSLDVNDFLTNLSNRSVEDWNKDISRFLGKPVQPEKIQEWFTPLEAAIRVLAQIDPSQLEITHEVTNDISDRLHASVYALYDDEPIGLLTYIYEKEKNFIYILNVWTDENYRRQGVATSMANYLREMYPNSEYTWTPETDEGAGLRESIVGHMTTVIRILGQLHSQYLYHVTQLKYIPKIQQDGLVPRAKGGKKVLDKYSKGKLFLADWGDIDTWFEWVGGKVIDAEFGAVPILLRVDVTNLNQPVFIDEKGSGDWKTGYLTDLAYYVENAIPPENLYIWEGSEWLPLLDLSEDIIEEMHNEVSNEDNLFEEDSEEEIYEDEEYDDATIELDYNWFNPNYRVGQHLPKIESEPLPGKRAQKLINRIYKRGQEFPSKRDIRDALEEAKVGEVDEEGK